MQAIPQRHPLTGQTAACLRAGVAAGRWREWLPAERALCAQLQVSRSTLRRALAQLQREGVVRAEHGTGNRILPGAALRPGRRRADEVALLAPDPIERLRPSQALWIDELRAMLAERGVRLHVVHGRQYFRAHPAAALERIVRRHPHACWLLLLAGAACQRWFAQRNVPCLVAGTCAEGLDLPSRDLDHHAVCRHAAGVLLGLGHRRLAFVRVQSPLSGDLVSEAGFFAGVRGSRRAEVSAATCLHDGTATGIVAALRRLMASPAPPTALLVANALHALAVLGALAQLGWRAPGRVSVVSRDDDPFLEFSVPEPARYVASPRAFARSLLQAVLEVLDGGAVSPRAARLMPRFVRGASLGPAPA